jgi:hypothetical protein
MGWVCWLVSCGTEPTPQGESTQEVSNFSLGQVVWVVQNVKKSATAFEHELQFSTDSAVFYTANTQANSITFQNGSSIEFVSADNNNDVVSHLISDSLAEREGAAFIGIKTDNLAAVKSVFRKREIPYSTIQATDKSSQAIFFPDFPRLQLFYFYQTADDKAATQLQNIHRNSALNLEEVWIAVDDFYAIEGDLASLGLPDAENVILQPFRATAKLIQLKSGSLHFLQRDHLEETDKQYLRADSNTLLGASIRMTSIEATAHQLQARRRINFATTRYNNKSCILIPPRYVFGSWLELARAL